MIYMWFAGINYYKLAVEKDRDFYDHIWKPSFSLVSSGNIIIASWLIWFIVCTWLTEFNDISVQYIEHSFRTQPELSNAKQSRYNIGGTYVCPRQVR